MLGWFVDLYDLDEDPQSDGASIAQRISRIDATRLTDSLKRIDNWETMSLGSFGLLEELVEQGKAWETHPQLAFILKGNDLSWPLLGVLGSEHGTVPKTTWDGKIWDDQARGASDLVPERPEWASGDRWLFVRIWDAS